MADDSSGEKVYLARQPILDQDRKTFAYELLFRSGATGGAVINDATQATARVLVNALNSMGVASLVGKSKAFINCDRKMLLENNFEPLDPNVFVLEILEDVVGDPEVAEVVKKLKEQGFEIALDDFEMTPEHVEKVRLFMPLANYVKIDLMLNTPEQIKATVDFCRKYQGIRLLAEKVETEEQYLTCAKLGYTLFQGYFFAKPEIISGRKLEPKAAGVMRLLQVLRQEPEIHVLEEAFKRQPEVTINMLKFINSASVGLRNRVDSIRLALTMIGQRKLQQWLMLMLFAGGGAPSSSNSSTLFDNAAQRSRFMENLAHIIDPRGNLHERAFLAGMLSRMDALCKVNIETILSEFDLGPELTNALRENTGILGDLLKITKAIEIDQLYVSLGLCQLHKIDNEQLQRALMESWAWVEGVKS